MSKLSVYTVILSVLVYVQGYEFDDAIYNQLLANELNDISYTAYSHPRVRRDDEAASQKAPRCPPPHFRKPKLCCADDLVESMHKEERQLKRGCFKNITGSDDSVRPPPPPGSPPPFGADPLNCEEINKMRGQIKCVHQCVGQKLNLIDADGNMKEDEISKYIKTKISPMNLEDSVQTQIVENCITEAKSTSRNTDQSKESCNPAFLRISHSLFKQIQLNCPEEQITDKEYCTKFQNRLKKGPRMPDSDESPPPPPPEMSSEEK